MPSAYMVVTATHAGQTHVLVGKKFPGMPNNGGQHVFPGGRVNHNEKLTSAASREFREETGIYYDIPNKRFDITLGDSCGVLHASTMDLGTHGILFVDIRYADLIRIKNAVANNIRLGRVDDAELQSIDIMTTNYALALMRIQDDPGNGRKRTEWFSNAIGEL